MGKNDLLQIWNRASRQVDPVVLLQNLLQDPRESLHQADAFLFWGKASLRTYEALQAECRGRLILGIYPYGVQGVGGEGLSRRLSGRWIEGEHPLPGKGSFRAGQELLEFFDSLRRYQSRRLRIFLSGGASSLAWIPRNGVSKTELQTRLRTLYAAGLDIQDLNAQRSRLCQLKAGGAADWLNLLAPSVSPEVFVLSDVAPNGPEIVGSGPFWNGRIPHRLLADNATLVQALVAETRGAGISILHSSASRLGSWQEWMQTALRITMDALEMGRDGMVILGGEPSIRWNQNGSGRGGRQTHLALALGLKLSREIQNGRVSLLAMSSDGNDGSSGAAGAFLRAGTRLSPHSTRDALRSFDSAHALSQYGALVAPLSPYPRSNVQDALLIRIHRNERR